MLTGHPRPAPRITKIVLIRKSFGFEAAHVLPHHPGKCARPHGHSYRIEVELEGPLQESGPATGMVRDFDELGGIVEGAVLAQLDHTSLNDLIPNPTAEHIALWIWNALTSHLPELREIIVWETATACAIVRSSDARAR